MGRKLLWSCLLVLIILTACSNENSKSTLSTTAQNEKTQIAKAQTEVDATYTEIVERSASQAMGRQIAEVQKKIDAVYAEIAERYVSQARGQQIAGKPKEVYVLDGFIPTSQSSSLFSSTPPAQETNSSLVNVPESSSCSETTVSGKQPVEQDIIPNMNASDALDAYNKLYSTPAPTLIFHVTDALGNPVPELPITIDPDGQNAIMLSRTDESGNTFWRHADIGTWDIVIDEQLKVFQKQKYQVIVTPELTPINLIWNFKDPSKLQIPIKSSILINVVNEKGEGISEVDFSIGIFANEAVGHTEELLLLGKSDLKGQKVWTNPDLGSHQLFLRYGENKYEFPIEVKDQKDVTLTFTLK